MKESPWLRKYEFKPKLTEAQEVEAERLYSEGLSLKKVAERYALTASGMLHILRRRGVKTRAAKGRRTYAVNESFFDDVSGSEATAYWAGFIAADGCITGSRKIVIQIRLAAKDSEHLQKFLLDAQSTHPIFRGSQVWKGVESEFASIAISSRCMAEGLSKIGIRPRKTTNLRLPDLHRDALRHFLRGYFDGDGCWSRLTGGKASFKLTGSVLLLNECQKVFSRECDLPSKVIRGTMANGRVGDLCYGGDAYCGKIAHYLYDGATIFLPRKYEKVKHLLED